MKILLLEHPREIPKENINDIANAPLSSSLFTAYIAGILQVENEVKIIEAYLEDLDYEHIYKEIEKYQPDVLGVHFFYQWNGGEKLYHFLKNIKEKKLTKYTYGYGYYSNFAYKEILSSCSEIDGIILGEPEKAFYELIQKIESGKDRNNLDGLSYINDEGKIIVNESKPIENLDKLPFPVRTPASLSYGEVNIMGSRGCYGSCTFCYINPFIGKHVHWRGRSPENIVAEIDEIIQKTDMRYFYFTDPNFFGPGNMGQERAKKLGSLLKSRKIKFGIEGRVNDIHEETIKVFVDAGLVDILVGLESGRQESLNRLNKMTTVEQNETAIRILRKYGVNLHIGFIMFEPDSSIEDIRINFNFLMRNHLLNDLNTTANVLYHQQIVLQGTRSYRELVEEGRLILSSTSNYEGTVEYENPIIADFVAMMKEITNIVFDSLKNSWKNESYKNPQMKESYKVVNDLLVLTFSKILEKIELEGRLEESFKKVVVNQAKDKILSIFNFPLF